MADSRIDDGVLTLELHGRSVHGQLIESNGPVRLLGHLRVARVDIGKPYLSDGQQGQEARLTDSRDVADILRRVEPTEREFAPLRGQIEREEFVLERHLGQ